MSSTIFSWDFSPPQLSYFLTQAWAIYCYIYPLGILCCERVIFLIKRSDHKCSTPLYWKIVEVRPRQASVLACAVLAGVVLAGTSEGLAGPRVLEGACCRCCGTEWFCRIVIVEILYSVEGGDVEQVCSNLEAILPCLWLLISLSLVFHILHVVIVRISYMLDIFLY